MFKLLKYLKPYWLSVFLLVTTLAGQVFCTLQLPALMSKIVNDGILTENPDITWKIGVNMLGFTLLSILFALATHFFSARVGAAFSRDLRNAFYRHVLSLSSSEIEKFSTASLITRTTNDISQVQSATMMMLTMLLRAPLMGIGAIIQAFRTAPDMTWIIALAVIAILTFSISILAVVIPKFKIFQKLLDKITLLARENLTGLRVIRAFNNEKTEQSKFSAANSELTKLNLFISKLMSLEDPLIGIVLNGTTLLVVWVGLRHLETDLSYLGNTIAFVQYATSVIISFLILTMLFVVLPRANVSAGRINEVFKTKSKIKFPETTAGSPDKTPSIEFKHVSFAYPGAEADVLSDISFSAHSGETTAFIGSTGSGKSTLISLVPRFFDPTSGEIRLNNLPLKAYSETDLMQKIGYVPQRGVLFSGTVKSNIAFGVENPDDALLKTAAKISQSENFIAKLDKKYDAHIAQGGTNVSGGQKQRLSIARAIAKRPEVYIFDDSFSALDMKTDKTLRAALKPETKNSIVLVVAQRINTIKDADQIIVLDNGKIVGKGTHFSLLKSCQTYREIVKSQFSETEYERELRHASK
ncbi:ABC transporter ATP-binding protein [Candidatus Saccharibacteria bacterium]|nr:ABC transporter ATP-binding protein [Candidatus Saccharibacteria bacterium]